MWDLWNWKPYALSVDRNYTLKCGQKGSLAANGTLLRVTTRPGCDGLSRYGWLQAALVGALYAVDSLGAARKSRSQASQGQISRRCSKLKIPVAWLSEN